MPTVMIIDDNKVQADMVSKVASKVCKDAVIKTFYDPFLALTSVFEDEPDLILVDFMMPKMDGIHFLREIRKKGIMTKAIIISAFMKKVSEKMLPTNHVAAVIGKPYVVAELMDVIRDALGQPNVQNTLS